MKVGARLLSVPVLFALLSLQGLAQDCIILNKGNVMDKDRLCSPVEVISWEITYEGVNNAGTPVSILFDWDDGDTETLPAFEGPAGTFVATGTHNYSSIDDKCRYVAEATLIVNGVTCTGTVQDQIIQVWDTDDENGGRVNASPNVYPLCLGEGTTMRFDDDTRFNCVPPQEDDDVNDGTRWIQWVYGTRNTMSSSTEVRVDGIVRSYPWEGPVKTLPGPVLGSSERSLPITVANDNALGEEFEVELRYWNYCNKYTDGADPVTDRSVIRVVGNPDPTISPEPAQCEFGPSVFLSAATGGGTWSGPGIVDGSTGEFVPSVAGPGTHTITYDVMDGNSCSASDTEDFVVVEAPDANIAPAPPFCLDDAPYDFDAATDQGTWSGPGITNSSTGMFNPSAAGLGAHDIVFTTDADINGCFGIDTFTAHVMPPPFAAFITPDSSWCEQSTNHSIGQIVFSGTDTSTFDISYTKNGVEETLTNLPNDTFDLFLNNTEGMNRYILTRVVEHHGENSCESELADTLIMQIHGLPDTPLTADYDSPCSPVEVTFSSEPGHKKYTWNFGGGPIESINHTMVRTFTFDYRDLMTIVGNDTIYDLSRDDSTYVVSLKVETFAGCVDSVSQELSVYPNPEANFHVFPEVQSHPDSVVYLTNLSSVGNWDYLWEYGDGNREDVKDPVEHIYDDYGIFDISLLTYSDHCRDSISKLVQILPPPPVAMFSPDTIGCPPLLVYFLNQSTYSDNYVWDFDDGYYSTEKNPSHVFVQNKPHQVKLISQGLSGIDSTTRIVDIYEPPRADFGVYPSSSDNLKQVFKFSNNSYNSAFYLWDFGDGTTSAEREPSHVYDNAGTYTISLYVWSENNCPDTLVRENLIEVIAGEGELYFPNVFVWNGSGPSGGHWDETVIDNTIFHPAVINAVKFNMIIYTRWGEKVFESNDLHIGWDGYLGTGELATEGVYVYKAEATFVDGTKKEYKGDITFLH